jgi:hypothetical protein
MEHEAVLEKLLDLALFIAVVGTAGVVAVAVVERLAAASSPLIRRRHIVITAAVLLAAIAAERIFHLVEG